MNNYYIWYFFIAKFMDKQNHLSGLHELIMKMYIFLIILDGQNFIFSIVYSKI